MATPEPTPLILDDASLKISKTADDTGLTELACVTNHLELTPETSSHDARHDVRQQGLPRHHEVDADRDPVPVVRRRRDRRGARAALATRRARSRTRSSRASRQPVSETNPSFTGFVIPQPYTPINGDAGDASEIELEWA